MSTNLRFVRDYPHPRAKVWRAITDPAIMAQWGMRPEGFAPVVGTRFKLIGKPNDKWRGFVECEVTIARAPSVIGYTWVDVDGGETRQLRYSLEQIDGGTRLTLEHRGFSGLGGFLYARLMMSKGWKKILDHSIPRVLSQLPAQDAPDTRGALQPTA